MKSRAFNFILLKKELQIHERLMLQEKRHKRADCLTSVDKYVLVQAD